MKSLALVAGDLHLGPGGYQTVTGRDRIRQDLALALGEEVGHDRFHTEWGSVLIRYIGQPLSEEVLFQVRAEVTRVAQQYIRAQNATLARTVLNQTRPTYTTDDVVTGITEATAEMSYDTIKVRITLQTQAGRQITISRTVNA